MAFLLILTILVCSCDKPHKGTSSDTIQETTEPTNTKNDDETDDQTDDQTNDETNDQTNIQTDDQTDVQTDVQTDDTVSSDIELCQHAFGEWEIVKQATCKDAGEIVRACSICSETEKESIPKNDAHTPVTDSAVPATCKDTGLTEGSHCSVCNKVLVAQETVPTTDGHTAVIDAAVPASCKDTGLTEGSHCSVCNKVLKEQETVSKLEHTVVVDEAVPSTCQSAGLTEGSHCSECGAVIVRQNRVSRLDHNFVDYICTACNESQCSKGLTYEKIDGGYKVTGQGSCTDKNIIVPNIYNGEPVIAIGYEAFYVLGGAEIPIESIVLLEGIEVIEARAFAYCKDLASVELPDSLKSIGEEAFLYNTSLEQIIIPDKVTTIEFATFRSCENLKNVTLSKNTKVIGNWAFDNKCGIESIELPDTVEQIGKGAFKGSSLKTCNIPDSLTYLGEEAFCESNIEEIVFGGNLSEIPAGAFKDCDSLKSVTFNSSIQKIGESAFNHASGLKTVVFSVGLIEIADEAFAYCSEIEELLLPEGLKSIGVESFRYNEDVTELNLPSTIQKIGENAFYHCVSIKSVTIPSGLNDVGKSAFCICGFETVIFEEGVDTVYYGMFSGCEKLKTITLPSTLKTIERLAFYECDSLIISSLPDSLESIGGNAFEGCTFKDFTLTSSLCTIEGLFESAYIDGLFFDDNITIIANRMFARTDIAAVEIPEGVTEIGEGAFNNCKSLSNVVFPSTLTHIRQEAFNGCDQISTLELPDNLKFIGANAFNGLNLIQQIVLPQSLEEIGKGAFVNCSRLSEITVPNIDLEGVFGSSVRTVHFLGTIEEAQTYICKAFPYSSKAEIYCSDGIPIRIAYSYNVYGTDIFLVITSDGVLTISGTGEVPYLNAQFQYADLPTKLVIEEGITKINTSMYGKSIFEKFPNIAEIEIPSTLVAIDKKMFIRTAWYEIFNSGTTPLYLGNTLVMVPTSVSGVFAVNDGTVTIAKHAFYGCAELTEIKLPLSVTTIEEAAFYGCENLAALSLHEGIETIKRQAISNCESLVELTIPSTVTELNGAITNCDNLKKIVLVDRDSLVLTGSIALYCESLETVVIGTGVTEFPINTLYDCPALKYIVVRGTVTEIDNSAFWNTSADKKFLCYSEETAELLKAKYPDCVYIYSENETSTNGLFWGISENGDIRIY